MNNRVAVPVLCLTAVVVPVLGLITAVSVITDLRGAGSGAAAAAAAPPTVQYSSPATSTLPTTVYLTIVTGAQTGKDNYPAYVPSSVTIPAHSKVTFVITNFDDATPLQAALFAKVTGTVGNTMSVTPIDPANPNAPGQATTVSQVDPNDVGHTFTAPGLGNLNIPVPGHAQVSFTVETGAAGTFDWNCFDPCGTGPDGTSGPMVTTGYMQGTITVT